MCMVWLQNQVNCLNLIFINANYHENMVRVKVLNALTSRKLQNHSMMEAKWVLQQHKKAFINWKCCTEIKFQEIWTDLQILGSQMVLIKYSPTHCRLQVDHRQPVHLVIHLEHS